MMVAIGTNSVFCACTCLAGDLRVRYHIFFTDSARVLFWRSVTNASLGMDWGWTGQCCCAPVGSRFVARSAHLVRGIPKPTRYAKVGFVANAKQRRHSTPIGIYRAYGTIDNADDVVGDGDVHVGQWGDPRRQAWLKCGRSSVCVRVLCMCILFGEILPTVDAHRGIALNVQKTKICRYNYNHLISSSSFSPYRLIPPTRRHSPPPPPTPPRSLSSFPASLCLNRSSSCPCPCPYPFPFVF